MKILVTGGAGYIGSHTCLALLQKGFDPVVADNLSNSSPEALRRVEKLAGRSLEFVKADICDPAQTRALFEKHSFDCIIHFAGLKAVGESVEKPLAYYRNNLDSTLTLCECMEEYGVGRLIFSSSATVYTAGDPMPLTEDSRTGDCTNPYGWTKYMIEQILRGAARNHPDWSVVLLRYFNPVGAHESGLIGEDPQGIPNNLMPFISQVAVGRREKLTVYGDDYDTPDGTGVRDYLHVCDLAAGHVAAVEYTAGNTGCTAINLGTGHGVSVLEMARAFSRVNGVPVPCETGPRRPGDIGSVWADPSLAARLLGWRAEKTLDDMCRDAYRWQSQNPLGYGGEERD